jgi:hypothetical protein
MKMKTICVALALATMLAPAHAANVSISTLPAAGALSGAELVPVDKTVAAVLTTVQTTTGAIAALAAPSIGVAISGSTNGYGLYVASNALAQFAYGSGVFAALGNAAGAAGGFALYSDARISGALQTSALGAGVSSALAAALNASGGLTGVNGSMTAGDCLKWSASGIQDAGAACGAGGGVTGPGTTVSGNLPAWNSTSGASLLDTGISASSNTLTGANSSAFGILAGVGQQLNLGGNGTAFYKISAVNNFVPLTTNTGNLGLASSASWWASASVQTLYLEGSSTGYDTIQSGTSTGTWTYKTPAATGTGTDTFATLGAAQTFTGAIGHSSTTAFSGAGLASPPANTTTILGGTTTWAPGTNAGVLGIGGLVSAPTFGVNGQGAVYTSATNGLVLGGQGSNNNITLTNSVGSPVAFVPYAGSSRFIISGLQLSGFMYASGTVPTVNTGTCTTLNAATGGSMAGKFTVNTTACTVGQTVILAGFTAVPNGYNCDLKDLTTPTAVFNQTALATTSATFTLAGVNTGTADTLTYKCIGF